MGVNVKPLFWVSSALSDFREFPEQIQRVMGFALYRAQDGGKHVDAKPLKGFGGAGVLEIVENSESDAYRSVYTIKFADAVYVLHCFQKKSTKGISTPKRELDLIRNRLKRAEEHYADWCKEGRSRHD